MPCWSRLAPILMLALTLTGGAAAQSVLYEGAVVIDGAGGPPRSDLAILTQGERIAAIAPVSAIAEPPGTTIVDARGLFVTPGLINTHEHLATPPRRAFAEAMMRRDLYGGVTAVRDMADDLRLVADLARAARVGEIPGPDIRFAALMAGPAFFEDPRVAAVTAGAEPGRTPWMQAIGPATDLPLAVAMARGTGAAAVKIYADLPAATVAAITREAHRQGLMVWAHAAVFPATPAQVLAAGVDSVSHVCMLAYQASPHPPLAYHARAGVEVARFSGGEHPKVAALFEGMRRTGQVLDATLWVYRSMARSAAAGGPAPYCPAALADALAGQAWRAGVTISAGTDGFSPAGDPWPALQDELELLPNAAGLPPMAVIQAATANGARAMGAAGERGLLRPGMLADMVFLSGDPSRDVRAFRSVVLTVKRGARYWRVDYTPSDTAAYPEE